MVEVDIEVVGMRQRLEGRLEQVLLGVAQDAAERAVDAREAAVRGDQRLADRRLVEGVAEALLGVAQLACRLALRRDVAADAEVARDRAVGRADGRDRERHRQPDAVPAHERPFARVGVVLSRAVPEHGRDGDAELGRQALELIGVVEQLGVMAPDDVGGAVAEHALGAAVEDRDQAVGVGADDRVLRRRVEHRR